MQILNKTFFYFVFIFSSLLFLSFLAFLYPIINSIVFFGILIFTLIISLIDLKYGVLIAFIELLLGSQGYLFFLYIGNFKISLRLGIFLTLFFVYLIYVIQDKEIKFLNYKNKKVYIIFALIIILGIINALKNKIPLKNIFLDVNAYFYFAYILIFVQAFNKKLSKEEIFCFIRILLASLWTMCLHSIVFLYIFSHNLLNLMPKLYKWTRDFRIGEIAKLFPKYDFYRIFFQHQIYAGLIFMALFVIFIFQYNYLKTNKKDFYFILSSLIIFFTTVLISFSRSFWVGLFIMAIIFLFYFIFYAKKNYKLYKILFLNSLVIVSLSFVLIFTIINFPIPSKKLLDPSLLLKNRIKEQNEPAVSSRWSLLPVLLKYNLQKPIIGFGFGKEITYQSKDPRILNKNNPQGWYTTYAFEWGYLDILLKIGLIGLLSFLFLIYKIIYQGFLLYKQTKENTKFVYLGFVFSIGVLMVIHIFTPYLNHPLGIGFLLFNQIFFDIS